MEWPLRKSGLSQRVLTIAHPPVPVLLARSGTTASSRCAVVKNKKSSCGAETLRGSSQGPMEWPPLKSGVSRRVLLNDGVISGSAFLRRGRGRRGRGRRQQRRGRRQRWRGWSSAASVVAARWDPPRVPSGIFLTLAPSPLSSSPQRAR